MGGLVRGPVYGPTGDAAGVMIVRSSKRGYGVAGVGFPKATIDAAGGLGAFFDGHSHAVIAEDVRSLAEAKRLGDAWARKFRKGLVLAPCACEDMIEAGAPSATDVQEGSSLALSPMRHVGPA
jgi:hypothetical protein